MASREYVVRKRCGFESHMGGATVSATVVAGAGPAAALGALLRDGGGARHDGGERPAWLEGGDVECQTVLTMCMVLMAEN